MSPFFHVKKIKEPSFPSKWNSPFPTENEKSSERRVNSKRCACLFHCFLFWSCVLTGKHGDTLKDRDTEGGRFRDVVINRGKFKSKLRWRGRGEGGKADASKTGISFPIFSNLPISVFLGQRIGGRVNCGRELKRSVLCLAPHTI